MTQHEKILDYLKTHSDGLTSYEATIKLHITKLTTRISELERTGIKFNRKLEKPQSKDIRPYYRYTLGE